MMIQSRISFLTCALVGAILAGPALAEKLPHSVNKHARAFAPVCVSNDMSQSAFKKRAKAAKILTRRQGQRNDPHQALRPVFKLRQIKGRNGKISAVRCSVAMKGNHMDAVMDIVATSMAQAGFKNPKVDRKQADGREAVIHIYQRGAKPYTLIVFQSGGKTRRTTRYVPTNGIQLQIGLN